MIEKIDIFFFLLKVTEFIKPIESMKLLIK